MTSAHPRWLRRTATAPATAAATAGASLLRRVDMGGSADRGRSSRRALGRALDGRRGPLRRALDRRGRLLGRPLDDLRRPFGGALDLLDRARRVLLHLI